MEDLIFFVTILLSLTAAIIAGVVDCRNMDRMSEQIERIRRMIEGNKDGYDVEWDVDNGEW